MSSIPAPQQAFGFLQNLINGVSQQPSNIRFANQADECVNMLPILQEQCGKRPPLEIMHRITGLTGIDANTKTHTYYRDENEGYTIVLNNTSIQIIRHSDGARLTPNMSSIPGGDTYHQASVSKKNFFLYTYKDTTFLVNRSVTCAMASSLSPTRTPEGLIKVKDAVNTATYDVSIKIGSTTYVMATQTAGATSTVNTVATAIQAAIVAIAGWGASGASASVYGNTVWVSHPSSDVSITVKDNRNGTAIYSFTQTIQKEVDLPVYAPNGYIVTVSGASSQQNSQDSNKIDDFVYRFEADAGASFGSGIWKENVAPGIKYQIDAKTMPHKLVRNSDGTFTYSQIAWEDRLVGDEITNPDPLFIGNTIYSCQIYSGRFGFMTGGGFFYGQTGEQNYFNMWRSTTKARLDTDPVFDSIPCDKVNETRFAIGWNEGLAIFGNNVDAAVSTNGNAFSLGKISVTTPTAYGISPYVPPFLSGSSVFFPKNNGDYSILYEYKLRPIDNARVADELTNYCGSYIPKDIIQMTGLEKDFMIMLADGDRSKLYCYNYSKSADGKLVQQAFHRWEFQFGIIIYGVYMHQRSLRVFYSFQGNFFLGSINCGVKAADPGLPSMVRLDMRIDETECTVSYNGTTNRTTITLPWAYGSNTKLLELRSDLTQVTGNYPQGYIPTIQSQTSTTIVLADDWSSAEFYVGFTYDSYYIPCRFHIYRSNPDGSGTPVADNWKDVTVKRLLLSFKDTAFYKVQIVDRRSGEVLHEDSWPTKFDTQEMVYDAYQLYTDDILVSQRFPMEQYKVILRNDSSKPSYFTGISWVGEFQDALN